MNESEIQDYYTGILQLHKIDYFHIPQSFYMNRKRSVFTNFPDLLFIYDNKVFLREIGIPGRHVKRKERQLEYMKKVKENNPNMVNIRMIFSMQAAHDDLLEIGLIG